MPMRRYGSAHWGAVSTAFSGNFVGVNNWGAIPLNPYNNVLIQDNTTGTGAGASGNGNFWHCHEITDADIPVNSTNGSVVVRALVSHVNNSSCGYFSKYGATGTFVENYSGGVSDSDYYHYNNPDETKLWYGSFGWVNTKDTNQGTRPIYSHDVTSQAITTDGWGNEISGQTFQDTGWGLGAYNPGTHYFRQNLFKGAVAWELALEYTFVLPLPIVATGSASGISNSSIQLNGTLNPNSATSPYPITYGWWWGTDQYSLENSYLPGTTLTGNAPTDVSYGLTGLTAGQSYFFELRAWTVTEPSIVYGGVQPTVTAGNSFSLQRVALI